MRDYLQEFSDNAKEKIHKIIEDEEIRKKIDSIIDEMIVDDFMDFIELKLYEAMEEKHGK